MADIDNKLDRVEAKVDKLDARLDDVIIVLTRQEENLKEHMRRSELNEEAVDILKNEVHHIATYKIKVDFLFKVLATIGGVIAVAASIIEILRFFS